MSKNTRLRITEEQIFNNGIGYVDVTKDIAGKLEDIAGIIDDHPDEAIKKILALTKRMTKEDLLK